MKKLFLLFLLTQTLLFGCATCQLMVPTAELKIDVNTSQKRVNILHISWNFSDLYSAELLMQYDANKNKKLDKDELKVIQDAMLTYLQPKKMLTNLHFSSNQNDKLQVIEPKYKNFEIKMPKDFLIFSYDAEVNLQIDDNSALSLSFEDDEGYFSFVVTELHVQESELFYTKNIYLFTASVLFSLTPTKEKNKLQELPKEVQEPSETITTQTTTTQTQELTQENILKKSITKIKSLFESIEDEKNPLTYLLLLFFAYVYGVVHALGPGHGKTLVASYFLTNERSYSKAFFVSLAIGVVHTFSAFLLTLFIYFVINSLMAQFLDDTVFYTTKISALLIISIALYLLYKKYKAYKKAKKPAYTFSATQKESSITHESTCGCGACKVDNNSTDLALIVSAGIIPCPGTVTIFIFSLSLGLYYAGFLSALVMSFGMSTIIFFSALLSVAIRKKTSQKHSKLKLYLEYASLFVILILGVVLLFT